MWLKITCQINEEYLCNSCVLKEGKWRIGLYNKHLLLESYRCFSINKVLHVPSISHKLRLKIMQIYYYFTQPVTDLLHKKNVKCN